MSTTLPPSNVAAPAPYAVPAPENVHAAPANAPVPAPATVPEPDSGVEGNAEEFKCKSQRKIEADGVTALVPA